jgi:hypothetical protein
METRRKIVFGTNVYAKSLPAVDKLVKSLEQFLDVTVYVGILESDTECTHEKYKIIRLPDIKKGKDIFTLYASKSVLITRMLQDHDSVFYLDWDLRFVRDPSFILDELVGCNVLLTPTNTSPKRHQLWKYGFFNAGFMGVNKTEETFRILDWWYDMTSWNCSKRGSWWFGDQLYLNYLHVRFDGVKPLRNPGCNVGKWMSRNHYGEYDIDKINNVICDREGKCHDVIFYHNM